ncbi:axonemal 1-beta dynein heavy chain dynein heavy related protein [Cyclospora cayetanensis]|uniref:Axonemal 1-beta dynein heavy chain dynein heavy related protein n=1 Tax=Cyclospora cayetanensis TaxID=88456 RepID=A0A1D3CX37_9EIME|nr:axonemal 1-beta dynein heavy chain dynein heavy related protein [Cyclospora cayetanensis]
MAFDARKAWIKKKVMGTMQLQDLSLWEALMSRTVILDMDTRPLRTYSDSNVQAYTLKLCSGQIDLTGKEMSRCIRLGLTRSDVLDDLALLLNGLLLPVLHGQTESSKREEIEECSQDSSVECASSPNSTSIPTQRLRLGLQESTFPNNPGLRENALDTGSDDSEVPELSETCSERVAPKSTTEEMTNVGQDEYTKAFSDACSAVDDPPHRTSSQEIAYGMDLEFKHKSVGATKELLQHILTASSRMAAALPVSVAETPHSIVDQIPTDSTTLEETVSRWHSLVTNLLDTERKRTSDNFLPVSEINFWKARYAAVSILYELLITPGCQQVLKRYEQAYPGSTVLPELRKALDELEHLNMESLSNVRFLSTLERSYFETLETCEMEGMARTIASLMNALRMVWVTSRHFTTDERMQDLFERIAYQLGMRVHQEVRIDQLLRGETADATVILQRSRIMLETWKAEYFNMRSRLEESECNRRWEFDRRKLFQTTDYMASMCSQFEKIANVIGQFKRFIGPRLHSVTRSRRAINRLTGKIQVYTEVDRMRNLFERHHENPPIPNHMPPTAGAILWSSGILQALKTSVLAFKQMPEVFDFDQVELVFGNYLTFAKAVTAYQKHRVKEWQANAAVAATECLKSYVLRREANGTYAVNFSPNVWVVMQEARHLDQLGISDAPAAVVNAALHKDFYEFIEAHRARVVETLQARYEAVTSYLVKIEELVEGRTSGSSEAMGGYYYYWERRIFNAIVTMLVRGKRHYCSTRIMGKPKFILLSVNLMCVPIQQLPGDEAAALQFTFYAEVSRIPALINTTVATHQAIQRVFQHITKCVKNWSKYEADWLLWNPDRKAELDQLIAKKPNVLYFDVYVRAYENLASELSSVPKVKTIGFIQLDSSEVINGIRKQALSLSKAYAATLYQIMRHETTDLKTLIREGRGSLEVETDTLERFKLLMQSLLAINESAMDAEIRLTEVQEMYRTLQSYKYPLTEAEGLELASLPQAWNELRNVAHRRKKQLSSIKMKFAGEKQQEVAAFIDECKALQRRFQEGTESADTTLQEGLGVITAIRKELAEFKRRAADLNSAENMFSLPLTNFPVLDTLERDIGEHEQLYTLYTDHDAIIKEWASRHWAKVDFQELQKALEGFKKRLQNLAAGEASRATSSPAYLRVVQVINGFRSQLPLVERLKNEAIRPQHWKELMGLAGQSFDGENQNLRLQDVLDLKLERFPDAEELKLEKDISRIESCWRQQVVETTKYKNDESRWVLKSNEELRMLLDDSLLQLQSMLSSRFASGVIEKIRKWEKSLNIIREVLDSWLQVQRKWMYLDGIFTTSIDIRLQLPKEAKRFDAINRCFLSIMKQTNENPNVLSAFCVEKRLLEMNSLTEELDGCQRSLSDYLDAKRILYPRFYFISDDELLSVLGSSGYESVQPLMLKLFDNCKELQINASGQVSGMESEEGENYRFIEALMPEGPAEEWMATVDNAMKQSLHRIAKEGIYMYGCKPRVRWVTEQLGMVACVGSRIWWTWRVEDAFQRLDQGDKNALRHEAAIQRQQVSALIEVVRKPLEYRDRKKVNTLIILDVHARDLIEHFVEKSVFSANSFEWESQLRFYWDMEADDIEIRQCTGKFRYGYEYQGLNGHLVITPLTDRCIMTLTTALTFCLGGAPAGPAGTGKTETVKDLAKSLANRCVIQNCGDGLDYQAMGTIFSGLVQTGFWGCFDEFNRINPEVLSVVSAQIKAIQTSMQNGKGSVELLGKSLTFVPTVGIFVTMNPGYAGRSELPDNLKALFRPATMTVPDMAMICEIMLMSEGFQEARIFAKKMTVLYELARAQLSKQHFYDFQLRALKAVLVTAGSMKRMAPESPDDLLLIRALRDMNIPKLVKPDVSLFMGLLGDLFPNVPCESITQEGFHAAILQVGAYSWLFPGQELERKCLKPRSKAVLENQVDKIMQLHATMESRHATMVVGTTGGGKTVIIEVLAAAHKEAFDEPVRVFPINPKAQGVDELYGVLDPVSRDWTDGLFSKIFRDANQPLPPKRKEKRIILFDGDVDAVWVESMNSVMDDNRLLTLPNGERIRLEKHCALLFEVSDLQYASPATVSRCGMVYVDQRDLGSGPYYDAWARSKPSAAMLESLDYLWDKYVPPTLAFLMQDTGREDEAPLPVKCIARTDISMIPNYSPKPGASFASIFVPTMDTVRAIWLLQGFASKALPTLFIGESGTAKSMMTKSWLSHLHSDEFMQLQMNFSSRTTSLDLQKAIEDHIDKRVGRIYGPPSGKVLKVFLDDLNMPLAILKKLPEATLSLYETVVKKMTRTPKKFHYIFNLRDLCRIYQGIWHATLPTSADGKAIVRLWRHESLRVFEDKLIDEAEKMYLEHTCMKNIVQETFPQFSDFALRNPIVWSEFRSALSLLEAEEKADSSVGATWYRLALA